MLKLVPDFAANNGPDSNSKLVGDINNAAEYAYQAYAEERGFDPDTIYKLGGACIGTPDHMLDPLAQSGYAGRIEKRFGRGVMHRYGVIDTGDGEIVFDPTWQQFLGGAAVNAPEVLIGTREQVIQTARSYGVGEHVLQLYQAIGAGDNTHQPYAEAA